MVVTSANSQHQQQHIHRLQEQFDQLQPPAGTGKSAVYSQLVFDFNIFVDLLNNVIMSSSRALKCRSAVEVSVSETLYRVARSRLTHFKFEYCAGAIACCGWREGER